MTYDLRLIAHRLRLKNGSLKYVYLLLILPAWISLSAQDDQREHYREAITLGTTAGSTGTLTFPFDDYTLNKKVYHTRVIVKLDPGDDHVTHPDVPFAGEVTVGFQAKKDGAVVSVLPAATATLSVSKSQPKDHFILDLYPLITTAAGNDDLPFDALEITVSSVTEPSGYYTGRLRLTARSETALGLDVRSTTTTIAGIASSSSTVMSQKVVQFQWSDPLPVNHYHLQVLRLHNLSLATAAQEDHITTRVDWSKALDLYGRAATDPAGTKSLTATLAEGTGYYTFRVRPIGAYYENGLGDSRNRGVWSAHDPQGTVKALSLGTAAIPYFFFTDPDDNKNRIYHRVFTENGKVKENLTFVNGLNQVRQSQTYLPSQDVTLVTQTISDHTGRPAVTTIPIPLAGRKIDYRPALVKAATTGEPYRARHFDTDTNHQNPEATAPFAYYHNNPDKSIPNDEGFGFTRTLWYNDASNRVMEQSGVGATHKIGGKTTRYLYATPSESELIALFGDEAPASESVLKTVTIDPNNIASVTYTSKEGHVIATSLAFYGQNTPLIDLDEPVPVTTVTHKITENTKAQDGFVSAKRISLAQDHPNFTVSYSIECVQFEQLCQVATVDCDYRLQVDLIALGTSGNVTARQALIDRSLSEVACTDVGGKSLKLVSQTSPIDLAAGNYIIQKRLTVGDARLAIAENTANINRQVEPLTDLIAEWLESVEDAAMLENFNKSLVNLAAAINNRTLDHFTNTPFGAQFPVTIAPDFFTDTYGSLKDQYHLDILPEGYDPYGTDAGENPLVFTLGTPCCIINIPIKWMPPFDCEQITATDANANGRYDIVNYLEKFDETSTATPEYFPDFEGYALAFMDECIGPDFADEAALKAVIYSTYMDGWEIEGTFNQMVYHMLTDVYNTENTAESTADPKVQYNCDRLLACWEAQLSRLKDELCVKFNFYEESSTQKVSDQYDDEYADDDRDDKYGKNHDSHFNDSFKGGFLLTKWIAKRKVSKRMRKLQAGESEEGAIKPALGQFHLVQSFLECTGYRFAKIITPFDAQPLTQDKDAVFTASKQYRLASGTAPVPFEINHSVNYAGYFGGTSVHQGGGLQSLKASPPYAYGYVPLSDWDPKKRVKNTDGEFEPGNESLFPFIKNPIYAFKYFEHADEYYTDAATGAQRSAYQMLETEVCYNDPNDCYQLDGSGFIVTDAAGQPVKVPCCAATPAWDAEGCYADTQYPGLHPAMVGYGTDGTGTPAKYIVTEFCEQGRVRCPYTHQVWSGGQRATFYTMLKNYVVPKNDEWEQVADFDLTCADLDTDHEWYAYTGDLDTQQENGAPDLVNGANIGRYDRGSYTQLQLQDGSTTFKYVELEIEGLLSDCNAGCERRRSEFESALLKRLNDKCYTIGGCRTDDPATFHIIPEEDIEVMVNALVDNCLSQCHLTTYSCGTSPCRSTDKAILDIGFDRNEFLLHYGMGGYNPAFCPTLSYTYNDATECTDPDGDGIYNCQLTDPLTGNVNLLSWYQHTKLQQATVWDFDIDMPTMCTDDSGNPIPTDDDLTCCGAAANANIGDTFVPKDDYEIDTNTPPDSDDPRPGDPVHSPVKGINVKVVPE